MSAGEDPNRRTAIVTGGSRGIGRAIAIALGGAGFRVAVNYHRNADAAADCADAVRARGGAALVVQADVARADDRARLVEQTLAAFGDPDLLVNNAGVAPRERLDLLETTEASFDAVMGVNLRGPFFLSQLVARHWCLHASDTRPDRWRAIVNISSISAYTASVNRGEYCLAKAAMGMMTGLFAARLADDGICVYEIRPGVIATDMTAAVRERYDRLILQEGLTPLRRWGRPEDVADAVLAIADGHLRFSTGEVINVDGGFHLRRL